MSKKNKDQKPEKQQPEIKSFEDLKSFLNDAERMEAAYNEQAAEDEKLSEVLTAASDLVPSEEELNAAQKTRLVIDLDRGTRKVEQEKPAEPQQVEMKMAADKHHIDPDELKEELDKEEPANEEVKKPKYRVKSRIGIASDGFVSGKSPDEYGTFDSLKSSPFNGDRDQIFPGRKARITAALRKHDLVDNQMHIDDNAVIDKYAEIAKLSEKVTEYFKSRINEVEDELKEIVLWEIRYNVVLEIEPCSIYAHDVYAPEEGCKFTTDELLDLLAA